MPAPTSLWTTELGRDAFVPLAGMAARCRRARLGTGVAIFARPPALTEISAMSMAELTQGRFVLGLGTAPPAWNENWHGPPLPPAGAADAGICRGHPPDVARQPRESHRL